MEQQSDKVFPQGMFFKEKNEKAPDFVRGHLSIKRQEMIGWLGTLKDEWVNIDMKTSKAGKMYLEVNTWKPEAKPETEEIKPEDIPF